MGLIRNLLLSTVLVCGDLRRGGGGVLFFSAAKSYPTLNSSSFPQERECRQPWKVEKTKSGVMVSVLFFFSAPFFFVLCHLLWRRRWLF